MDENFLFDEMIIVTVFRNPTLKFDSDDSIKKQAAGRPVDSESTTLFLLLNDVWLAEKHGIPI